MTREARLKSSGLRICRKAEAIVYYELVARCTMYWLFEGVVVLY